MLSFIKTLYFFKDESYDEALLRFIHKYEKPIRYFLEKPKAHAPLEATIQFKKGLNGYTLTSNVMRKRSTLGSFLKYKEDEYHDFEEREFAKYLIQTFQTWLQGHGVEWHNETTIETITHILSGNIQNSQHLPKILTEYQMTGQYNPLADAHKKEIEIFLC